MLFGRAPGSGASAVPGQELCSPMESDSVGQPRRRTDNVMGRKLLLGSGASLWLWLPSASSTTALFQGHTVVSTGEVPEESLLMNSL